MRDHRFDNGFADMGFYVPNEMPEYLGCGFRCGNAPATRQRKSITLTEIAFRGTENPRTPGGVSELSLSDVSDGRRVVASSPKYTSDGIFRRASSRGTISLRPVRKSQTAAQLKVVPKSNPTEYRDTLALRLYGFWPSDAFCASDDRKQLFMEFGKPAVLRRHVGDTAGARGSTQVEVATKLRRFRLEIGQLAIRMRVDRSEQFLVQIDEVAINTGFIFDIDFVEIQPELDHHSQDAVNRM
jgi:hypothetical protein